MNSATRTLDELLQHERFVQRLARSLLGTEGDADDLVQETWLRAVQHPPDSRGQARGWLGTVMRNLARDWQVGTRGREGREAAAARPEASPPLQQLIEKEETRRKIVEALSRLPEPQASAIVLRFFDGLPPREIARRLAVPVETVRKRLGRGVAQLREELDGTFEGGREGWTAALPLLVGAPSGGGGAAAAVSASAMLGAVLMSTTAKVVCALVIVSVGALFVNLAVRRADVRPREIEAPHGHEIDATPAPPSPVIAPIAPRRFQDASESAASEPVIAREVGSAAGPSLKTFIVGRFVGDIGAPFLVPIKAIEYVRSEAGRSSHETPFLELDHQGGFRVELTEPFRSRPPDVIRELVFTAPPMLRMTNQPPKPAYGARIDLSRDLAAGDVDIGNVTMKLAPLIVGGIVVDPTGQPVSGARIRFHVEQDASLRPTMAEVANEIHRAGELNVDSTDDGTFEVRGFIHGSKVTVEAAKTGWKDSDSVGAAVGSTGLRLRLGSAGGTFKGRVIVDAGIPLSLIVIEYHLATSSMGLPVSVTDRCQPDGSFEFQSPGPETLRVVVGAIGVDAPLADVSGIILGSGQTTRDPQLDPLDLRGRLRLLNVTVVDRELRALHDATVFVEPSADARSEYGIDVNDGRASLLTLKAAVDLRVEAAGFRTTRVARVTKDTQVVMLPALRVSFAIQGQLPKLPSGVTPKVILSLLDDRLSRGPGGDAPFLRNIADKRGSRRTHVGSRASVLQLKVEIVLDSKWSATDVAIPEPGLFGVEMLLEQKYESGSSGLWVAFATPPRLTVKDQDDKQAIVCPAPSAEAIEEVLRQLKR